jgi:hypothetical protein
VVVEGARVWRQGALAFCSQRAGEREAQPIRVGGVGMQEWKWNSGCECNAPRI